ncbi:MAG TPA: hypothetical protein VGL22_06065 [Terracidiphilus sp.]
MVAATEMMKGPLKPLSILLVTFCAAVFDLPAQTPSSGPPASAAQPAPTSPAIPNVSAEMQQEAARSDVTYLRSYLVYRYDYKQQQRDVTANRFRLRGVYGFGPQKRLGVAVTVPFILQTNSAQTAFGLGDIEPQFGGNLYLSRRFRTGAAVEFTLQTATNSQLGGNTTIIKPAWGFTAVPTDRNELNCVFNYNRSIHVSRGAKIDEFEPDCTINTRRFGATEYVEWDSYYQFAQNQLAQTMQIGFSRTSRREKQCVLSPYVSFPLNQFGRQTQFIVKVGMDISWFSSTEPR